MGWLSHPIFSKSGGYPPVMVEAIASNSVREGRPWSRLPEMSPKIKAYIQGSADFLGLNYYTSRFVSMNNDSSSIVAKNPSWEKDASLNSFIDPSWKRAKSTWLYSVPQGLGDILRYHA